MATNEIGKIYEMVLSTPGMADTIKIELKIPRKNVFLLAKAIDLGLSDKNLESTNSVLSNINKEVSDELSNVSNELLQKAELTKMNDKLQGAFIIGVFNKYFLLY